MIIDVIALNYNSFNRYEISSFNNKEVLIKGEKIDEFFGYASNKKGFISLL